MSTTAAVTSAQAAATVTKSAKYTAAAGKVGATPSPYPRNSVFIKMFDVLGIIIVVRTHIATLACALVHASKIDECTRTCMRIRFRYALVYVTSIVAVVVVQSTARSAAAATVSTDAVRTARLRRRRRKALDVQVRQSYERHTHHRRLALS